MISDSAGRFRYRKAFSWSGTVFTRAQQAEEIDAALDQAGVASHLIRMIAAGHGFRSPELDQRIRAFLDRHLRGQPAELSDTPIATPPARPAPH